MADYNINAVTRRVVFSGSAGTGPYAFTFEILDENDIAVYFNATLLTLTTDYTVSINANGTGSVTIVVGTNVPTTPDGDDSITIVGARDIERTTDFVTAGDFRASAINEQLDALTIFDQQISERVDRSIIAPVTDPTTIDMTLPAKADRLGKALLFNSSTGNPEAGPTVDEITNAQTYATNASNSATAAASSATAAASSATAASSSATSAASSAAAAAAATGGVKVSSNDTTPSDLEAKMLASGLVGLSTQNDGANETRTIDVPIASQAQAEAGTDNATAMTPLRAAQAIAALGSAADQLARDVSMTALILAASTGGVLGPVVSWVADTDNFATKTGATFTTDYYSNAISVTLGTPVESNKSTTTATSHTFSAVAIGTAASDRLVAVCAGNSGYGQTISSVTVGGVSASQEVAVYYTSALDIWVAAVPTGTTADIVVTFTGSAECGISVWPIYGASGTIYDTLSHSNANPLTGTIDCEAGGAIVAGCSGSGPDTLSWTWVGVTEDHDVEFSSDGHSGASDTFTSAQTGLTVSATATGTANGSKMVAIALSSSGGANDMLLSDTAEAITADPDTIDIYVEEETVDASPTRELTASIDGGSTYSSAGTLQETYKFGSRNVYRYSCDVSGQTGSSLKIQYDSLDDGKVRKVYSLHALPIYP